MQGQGAGEAGGGERMMLSDRVINRVSETLNARLLRVYTSSDAVREKVHKASMDSFIESNGEDGVSRDILLEALDVE